MGEHHKEPRDFSELASWACWQVIEGITAGKPMRQVMWGVLDYVRRWMPVDDAAGGGEG